jgi:hypothetical protein
MAIDKTDLMLLLAGMSGGDGARNLMQGLMAKAMVKGSGRETLATLVGMMSGDRTDLMSSLSALGAAPQTVENNRLLGLIAGKLDGVDADMDATALLLGQAGIPGDTVMAMLGRIEAAVEEGDGGEDLAVVEERLASLREDIEEVHVPGLRGAVSDLGGHMDEQVADVKSDIAAVEDRLAAVEGELASLRGSLEQTHVPAIRQDVAGVGTLVARVDDRVLSARTALDGQATATLAAVAAVDGKVVAAHTAVDASSAELRAEVSAVGTAVLGLETRADDLDEALVQVNVRLDGLETMINALNVAMLDIQAALGRIEVALQNGGGGGITVP